MFISFSCTKTATKNSDWETICNIQKINYPLCDSIGINNRIKLGEDKLNFIKKWDSLTVFI